MPVYRIGNEIVPRSRRQKIGGRTMRYSETPAPDPKPDDKPEGGGDEGGGTKE